MNDFVFFCIFLFYLIIIFLCFVVFVIKFKRENKISSYIEKRKNFKIIRQEDDKLQ